ncbi:MAG: HIT domain-containing protein [Candidatus Paceibacterota bacterium]
MIYSYYMKSLTLYDGRRCSINNCIGCDVYNGNIDMSDSLVYENDLFRVVHDTENPIPGFFVISSKRHVRTLNELNSKELENLFNLIVRTRKGMEDILGIEKVSLIQEDGPENMHFHLWFFPWYSWMNELELIAFDTEKMRKIMKYSQENMRTDDNIQKVHNAVEAMKSVY